MADGGIDIIDMNGFEGAFGNGFHENFRRGAVDEGGIGGDEIIGAEELQNLFFGITIEGTDSGIATDDIVGEIFDISDMGDDGIGRDGLYDRAKRKILFEIEIRIDEGFQIMFDRRVFGRGELDFTHRGVFKRNSNCRVLKTRTEYKKGLKNRQGE